MKKRPRRKGGRLIVEGDCTGPPPHRGPWGCARLWRILHPARRLIPPLSGGSARYFTVPGERIPAESADAERVGAAIAADRGPRHGAGRASVPPPPSYGQADEAAATLKLSSATRIGLCSHSLPMPKSWRPTIACPGAAPEWMSTHLPFGDR